jgi:hypothetical protein
LLLFGVICRLGFRLRRIGCLGEARRVDYIGSVLEVGDGLTLRLPLLLLRIRRLGLYLGVFLCRGFVIAKALEVVGFLFGLASLVVDNTLREK